MQKSHLLILLIFLAIFSCRNQQETAPSEEDTGAAVDVQQVNRDTYPVTLEFSGNIRPWEQVFITSTAGKRIDQIYADVGDEVKAGALLVQMNNAQLQQALAQLQLARKTVNRLDTLLELGSVSQERFDQAQTEYETALNNYQMLAENTRLDAPFSGVITNKYFYEGEQFSPSAQNPSILTLMQLDPVKVIINISEDHYTEIDQGMKALVMIDNYPDTTFSGTIYKKYPTIDEETRTFTTEVRIENNQKLLRPGMYAQTRITLDEEQGIYIPISAIVSQPGTDDQFVYVVENNTAERVQVETGNQYNNLVLIESGLQQGDRLVTEGMAKLQDGTKVRIINQSEDIAKN